jgi:hypothetical protein
MTLHKALVLGLCCAFIDLLGARLLDSLGPAASAFYGARFITYFVLPALVVAKLVFASRRSPAR